MEGAYKKKYASANQYSPNQLRRIGQQCSSRLPPASAVQAMFLYQMQRESEAESLFQGGLFELAKYQDAVSAQESRLEQLHARMEKLEKYIAAQDVEQRLVTSKMRMQVQQDALKACSGRVDGLETKFAALDKSLSDLKTAQETAIAAAVPTAPSPPLAAASITQEDAETIQSELDILFHDRDGILALVDEAKGRITRLEDNVRALTVQGAAMRSPTTSSPQLIAMQTSSGDLIDLNIPKGKPHVSLKENRPRVIRSFSPGKQWQQ